MAPSAPMAWPAPVGLPAAACGDPSRRQRCERDLGTAQPASRRRGSRWPTPTASASPGRRCFTVASMHSIHCFDRSRTTQSDGGASNAGSNDDSNDGDSEFELDEETTVGRSGGKKYSVEEASATVKRAARVAVAGGAATAGNPILGGPLVGLA